MIVVKIGGALISEGLPEALVDSIVSLTKGHKVILVHGGGDVVTKISTELGHPPSSWSPPTASGADTPTERRQAYSPW